MSQKRMSSSELRKVLSPSPARSTVSRKYARAKRTRVNGISFPSKTEANLYLVLLRRSHNTPGAVLLRQVRFDLPSLSEPIEKAEDQTIEKPETWQPDFLLIEPLEDGGWNVTAHEAKGRKGTESRDFKLRLRAFRLSYPDIPVTIWRTAGKDKVAPSDD